MTDSSNSNPNTEDAARFPAKNELIDIVDLYLVDIIPALLSECIEHAMPGNDEIL
jgi:hypothetical protein